VLFDEEPDADCCARVAQPVGAMIGKQGQLAFDVLAPFAFLLGIWGRSVAHFDGQESMYLRSDLTLISLMPFTLPGRRISFVVTSPSAIRLYAVLLDIPKRGAWFGRMNSGSDEVIIKVLRA
jgi:hypothetical protein